MRKKLIMSGMAIAAVVAFAIPAIASASPELRDSAGKVAVGAHLKGTSTNTVITNTPFSPLVCQHTEWDLVVDVNSGTQAGGHTNGSKATNCSSQESIPVTLTEFQFSLETTGGDSGTLSLTFIVDVGPFECQYEGTGGFTYSTGSGNNTLHVSGISLSSSEICEPEEGASVTHGDISLTTASDGSPVWVQ